MKIAFLMPIHVYKWDPHSQLFCDEKIKLYEFAISEQYNALKGKADLFIIGHGEKKEITLPPNVKLIWSDFFQEPTKFGIFKGFPAQWNIVLEGVRHLKNLGYTHVIKSRGDSIIKKPQIMLAEISFASKTIFTQQTTYQEPFELGDCFMSGPIDNIISLWSPHTLDLPENGLEFMANQFIENSGEKRNDFINILVTTSSFFDLGTLCVVDCRFNWKDDHSRLKSGTYKDNYDEFLWGAKNKWITYCNRKIISSDRKYLVTERYFQQLIGNA